MTRMKLADLTSGVGALVLGIGVGALFAPWVGTAAGVVALVGAFAHAFGMWDKHRLESDMPAERSPAVQALYWLCWLLLAGVVGYVLV